MSITQPGQLFAIAPYERPAADSSNPSLREAIRMVEELNAEVVVAGGGVGGLMAAYRAHAAGARVLLLTGSAGASKRISSLNTALGYGELDTPAAVFDDMVHSGCAVNNLHLVAALAERIGPEVEHLAQLGVPFEHRNGRMARRQAAGSTWTRSVYSLGMVGVDISNVLLREMNDLDRNRFISIKGGLLLKLWMNGGQVAGALAYNPREDRWLSISAPSVVLATGGCGQLYTSTSNPRGSRGVGYSIALEAGAELSDLEFVSFEPFITAGSDSQRGHDLPTTVLREGARLRNGLGEEFLDTSNSPSKDIICRAMVREVAEGRGTPNGAVYYDLRKMDPEVIGRYVQITTVLRARGLEASEAQLEVMPAQHYLMGGIRVRSDGSSTIPGLFAVGEAAAGAHGAHRLAAAGGMEVVAGGAIAGESASDYAQHASSVPGHSGHAAPAPALLGTHMTDEDRRQLGVIKAALSDGCGILRERAAIEASIASLQSVLDRSRSPHGSPFIERSALLALSIAGSALHRCESRGDHFRVDHPRRNDVDWLGNVAVSLEDSGELSRRFDAVQSGPHETAGPDAVEESRTP